MTGRVATGPGMELREGPNEEALADVAECDALITDPPFSGRVHKGQRTGSSTRKTTLHYDAITEEVVARFVARWAPAVRWWAVVFSDHLAQRWWEAAWQAAGWYVFAPVLWVRECPTPRMAGDGPTSACDYITIARPRHRLPKPRIGSRPGFYLSPRGAGGYAEESTHPGSKRLDPMRALVRDYSQPGDLVVDPFAGSATTLVAAAMEGREAIGAEVDPATFELAAARIRKGYTPDLFGALEAPSRPENLELFAAGEAADR